MAGFGALAGPRRATGLVAWVCGVRGYKSVRVRLLGWHVGMLSCLLLR